MGQSESADVDKNPEGRAGPCSLQSVAGDYMLESNRKSESVASMLVQGTHDVLGTLPKMCRKPPA